MMTILIFFVLLAFASASDSMSMGKADKGPAMSVGSKSGKGGGKGGKGAYGKSGKGENHKMKVCDNIFTCSRQ